jgi:hypothetical protein
MIYHLLSRGAPTGLTVITCGDIATDFISALFTGTQFDIAASDQINPIATTVVIPIHLLILHPLCCA